MVTRADFIKQTMAVSAVAAFPNAFGDEKGRIDYEKLQREIDDVSPVQFADYLKGGQTANRPALQRLDEAFEKVLAEIKSTSVTSSPAVWLVYNMGVVVKTKEACFSIDLKHRNAVQMAPLLDFALISHNHDDHFTESFYRAMDGSGKTVISNFKDNYGVKDRKLGGYTRANKAFRIADVEICTSLTDHNPYLVDFTSVFEINVNGFRILHSGDCFTIAKLNPSQPPDLWIVHPRCGMKVVDGVRKFSPKVTVLAHLNELGHAKGHARWTYEDGLFELAGVEKAGGRAMMPRWGDRVA